MNRRIIFLMAALVLTACAYKLGESKYRKGKVMGITRSINGVGVATDKWAFVMRGKDDVLFYCVVNEDTYSSYRKSSYGRERLEANGELYACPIENVREMK